MENIQKQPLLAYLSPSGKFWVLMLLFLFSLLLFSLLATLVLIPFTGIRGLAVIAKTNVSNDVKVSFGFNTIGIKSRVRTIIAVLVLYLSPVQTAALPIRKSIRNPE